MVIGERLCFTRELVVYQDISSLAEILQAITRPQATNANDNSQEKDKTRRQLRSYLRGQGYNK